MAHHAFVVGCNGLPGKGLLKWAQSDGDLMAEVLRSPRCSYHVTQPLLGDKKWAKVEQLERAIAACRPDDTFLMYFAGHGILAGGKLHLVWQTEGADEFQASIGVNVVLDLVQRCEASNKLVILDCCHAGAAGAVRGTETPVEEVTAAQPDNYLLLMGSKRVETVREFDDFSGTFLSAQLRAALGAQFDQADKDQDRRLSFDDLKSWLEASWATLAPERRAQVPVPHHFGKQLGKLYLTPRHAAWQPVELAWPIETAVVFLPVRPREERAMCMARHVVSNAQYRQFCKETGHSEPLGRYFPGVGDRFDLGTWRDGFRPWETPGFDAPSQPVVCVSLPDAVAYRRWFNAAVQAADFRATAILPPPRMWRLAAFGSESEPDAPADWLGQARSVHHRDTRPLPNDSVPERQNALGLSDMVGNVWEWCPFIQTRMVPRQAASSYSPVYIAEKEQKDTLHGGGFLDDLEVTRPYLETWRTGGAGTRHFDVGFRIAGTVDMSALPKSVRGALLLQPDASTFLWDEINEAVRQ
jgi:formylglycine-generating enzyme required for sulfatase activity